MTMEAETGTMKLKTKERRTAKNHLKLKEVKKDAFLETSEGAWPC